MLPKDWELRALEEICQNEAPITYGVLKPGEYYPEGIPLLQIKDMVNGGVSVNDLHRISPSLDDEYKRSRICDDDILISLVGTIGRVAKVKGLGCANIHRNIGRVRSQYHDYLFHFLRSDVALHEMGATSSGSSQSALNLSTLRAMKVPFPPLAEQKKIAQILSTWDQAIATTERLIDLARQQKKALMQQLLARKKRFPGFEEEWKKHTLGELGDTFNGLTGKTKEDFGFGKKYIPYINIFKNSQIDVKYFDLVSVQEGESQSLVQYGDIFFTTSSETPDEVGMSSVLLDKVDELYLNSFCFGYRLFNFYVLLPEFARHFFRSEHVRGEIAVLGQGATRYNLSKKQLMKLEVILPSVEEQERVTAILNIANQEIEILQSQLDSLKQEKKALMQALLTGKRRVQCAIDEAGA